MFEFSLVSLVLTGVELIFLYFCFAVLKKQKLRQVEFFNIFPFLRFSFKSVKTKKVVVSNLSYNYIIPVEGIGM